MKTVAVPIQQSQATLPSPISCASKLESTAFFERNGFAQPVDITPVANQNGEFFLSFHCVSFAWLCFVCCYYTLSAIVVNSLSKLFCFFYKSCQIFWGPNDCAISGLIVSLVERLFGIANLEGESVDCERGNVHCFFLLLCVSYASIIPYRLALSRV